MSKWVVIRLMTGTISMLAKDHRTFTERVEDAAQFDTEAEGKAVAQTIKTPLIVQQLGPDVVGQSQFPVPDYFESPATLMGLQELIDLIRKVDLTEYFTPVDSITGAKQMTGGAVVSEFANQVVGRKFQFSFDRVLSDEDANELYNVVSQTGAWTNMNYRRIRLGFTEYAVLTLWAKNR